MADELGDLPGDRQLLESTQAWIGVLSHAAFLEPSTADGSSSAQWVELLDHAEMLDQHHPFSDAAMPLRRYYDAIAHRRDAISKLRQVFQSKLLGPMYVYPDGSGQVYYSDRSPQADVPAAHVVEYFSDLAMHRKTKNFGARYRQQVLPQVRVAGHSAYCAQAARAVASMKEGDFTPAVYRLISELRSVEVDQQIDPILKLDLTRRILTVAVEGSAPLSDGFGDWQEALDASDFPWDTNWIAPSSGDSTVQGVRQSARELLQTAGDWDQRVARMGESFRRFREPRPQPPRWVGWVARQQDQFVALLEPQQATGDLCVVVRDAATGAVARHHIDPVVGTAMRLIQDPAGQVVGAPVCLFP